MAGKSLLEQLMEEAAQHGASQAAAEDFAVSLSTTDADGTHTIDGVPLSKVGAEFLAKFGIGTSGQGGGEGDGAGDGGDGEGKSGPKRAPKPGAAQPGGLRNLFPAQQSGSKPKAS